MGSGAVGSQYTSSFAFQSLPVGIWLALGTAYSYCSRQGLVTEFCAARHGSARSVELQDERWGCRMTRRSHCSFLQSFQPGLLSSASATP